MHMDPGKLDRRAALYHRVLTHDTDTGEQTEDWSTAYATVWAGRADLRGREYFAAQEAQNETTARFQIRWRSDVEDTDRVLSEGVWYKVVTMMEMGRRDGLELMCTTVAG